MFSFGLGGGGSPFEGGHGHGHGHGMPRGQKPVDNESLYKNLGIEKNATQQEIKKAFRKKAMKLHPDKGGDEHLFKECQKAYEILGNPEKRDLYDEYGEEGVERGGPPMGGMGGMDIFDLFTGGGGRGGGGGGHRRKRRGEDVVFPLKVSLEDMYNGSTKRLKLSRKAVCKGCSGTGSKSGKSSVCGPCRGRGIQLKVRQIGPGMIQQMQSTCSECNGTGESVDPSDRCDKCKGKKLIPEKRYLEVHVDKGMKHGQKITFNGEADEEPNVETGDVIVVLQQAEHPVFTRDGPNLLMRQKITLLEALTGFEFNVTHLDKRVILVKSTKGQIIKPNAVLAMKDEGMPKYRSPFSRGSLLIQFQVEFPTGDQVTSQFLKQGLPAVERMVDTTATEMHLVEFDLDAEKLRRATEHEQEAYESDDEGAHQHGGPSCKSM